jgi:hypothetical protein
MAARKKTKAVNAEAGTAVTNAELFEAHGVTEADLKTARDRGYSIAFLYETKGLQLDKWEKVWFAFRVGKEEEMQRTMSEAVRTGNARNPVRVEF